MVERNLAKVWVRVRFSHTAPKIERGVIVGNIFFTSDLHLCHDREFLYKPRHFESIDDMNEAIVYNWNQIVGPYDITYILGDVMLNDNDTGMELLNSLNGQINIMLGNHDTIERAKAYRRSSRVMEISFAKRIRLNGYNFYLSHYPTMTGHLEKEKLKSCIISLYGHTHQLKNFYNDIPFIYHVGVDSHKCIPVRLETIIKECEDKFEECRLMTL